MPISSFTKTRIQEVLPRLSPQPYAAQVDKTMEFREAEKKFKLRVDGAGLQFGLYKAHIGMYGKPMYYEPLWAYNGRPYIRIYDDSSGKGELIDIFLLPPPKQEKRQSTFKIW
jgi:hypothetical protein